VPARLVVAGALVAALLLATAVSAGSAGASGPGSAVAAKKCKKAHKRAASAKKKKCKKKMTPTPVPLPGPIVRATITWPAGEVDLHAFDSSGARSGITLPCPTSPCSITEGIPNATHSPDVANGGSETFTDNIFIRGGLTNREFAYAICFYTNTTVTFTGVNKLGQSNTIPITDVDGAGHSLTIPGGPPVPSNFACPGIA
jgi:hypothetical protein